MISIGITEKAWDAVRPDSVKKTGLSEAIRAFTKSNAASALKTPQGFDALDKAIQSLRSAIDGAARQTAGAKDDKKGAAAKLKAWSNECAEALAESATMRSQAGVLLAVAEADQILKERVAEMKQKMSDAGKVLADAKGGKAIDNRAISTALQSVNVMYRDGNKFAQKDSFKSMIATYKAVTAWKLDPAAVPQPPAAKEIKAMLPAVEKLAEELRLAAERAIVAAGKGRSGSGADLAKDLVGQYRRLGGVMKATIPNAKATSAKVKELADKWKPTIQGGADHQKVLPVITKMHALLNDFDDKTMAAVARGRTASGDLQKERLRIRATLEKGSDTYKDFETITGDEWALVMSIYQQVSAEIGKGYTQVDRLLRLVGEVSPEAKSAAAPLEARFKNERKALSSKYL